MSRSGWSARGGGAARRGENVGVQYLRGLAALMVVGAHAAFQHGDLAAAPWAERMVSGVDIFFVISGFVMVYATDAGRGVGPGDFVRRRLVRIVPLYWAATLATIAMLLVAPQLLKTTRLAWPHAIASLLFVPWPHPGADGGYYPLVFPGWTLNLEMFFYAVFALAMLAARGSAGRLMAGIAAVLGALAVAGMALRPGGWAGFFATPLLLEFLYGAVLGMLALRREGTLPWPVAAAVIAGCVALLLIPAEGEAAWRGLRFGLPAGAIVAAGSRARWPRIASLHLLGDASYSLYLSHFFTLSAFAQGWRRLGIARGPGEAALFHVGAVAAAVTVAIGCRRYVERPLTRWAQRRFADRAMAVPVSLRA